MKGKMLNQSLEMQKNEITEYHIYKCLAADAKGNNKRVLERISRDELSHYTIWKALTEREVEPDLLKVKFYSILAKIGGINFSLRLMESGEESAQKFYKSMAGMSSKIKRIIRDEESHEKKLLDMIDEEHLRYTGSIVLGLNDALIELTGALAGFTLALQNTKLVAIAGLMTGIAASMSMAASGYLSSKEEGAKNPIKATIYTGLAYFITVLLLVLPYFTIGNLFASLGATLIIAMLIISVFNFYVSVAKGIPFKRRFLEMTVISLGVAAISFVIGFVVNKYLGINI
ncbi:MAG: VIT1/CCC1 transporter family protein [Candidatus Micrarchaeia archaeon]